MQHAQVQGCSLGDLSQRSDNALLKFMHVAKVEQQHKLWKIASDFSRSHTYNPGM